MKKWMKGTLIAAGCLAGLGAVLTAAGLALGGFSGLRVSGEADSTASSSYRIAADQIRGLDIEWVEGNVILEPWEKEEILIEETSGKPIPERDQMEYKVQGETLKISYLSPGIRFGFRPSGKTLHVYLPQALARELVKVEIENVSADIQLKDLKMEKLEMNTVSGDLQASGLTAAEVEFESVSGSLRAQLSACPREVEVETVSGDAELTLPENSRFRAELDSVSGDLESELSYTAGGGEEGPEISMESVSGDLRILKGK